MSSCRPVALAFLVSTSAFAGVDANKASQADLESITGLGPATASMVLDERGKGLFKDWIDLIGRVKGVGDRSAARLSAEGLTVNGASYKDVEAGADAKARKGAVASRRRASDADPSAAGK